MGSSTVLDSPVETQGVALSRLRQKKAALEFLMQPTFHPLRSLALDRAVLAIERREGRR